MNDFLYLLSLIAVWSTMGILGYLHSDYLPGSYMVGLLCTIVISIMNCCIIEEKERTRRELRK